MKIHFLIISYLHEWICVNDFFITFTWLCSWIFGHRKCLSIARLTCEITKKFWTITNVFFRILQKPHLISQFYVNAEIFAMLTATLRNVQRFAFIQRLWWLICLRFFVVRTLVSLSPVSVARGGVCSAQRIHNGILYKQPLVLCLHTNIFVILRSRSFARLIAPDSCLTVCLSIWAFWTWICIRIYWIYVWPCVASLAHTHINLIPYTHIQMFNEFSSDFFSFRQKLGECGFWFCSLVVLCLNWIELQLCHQPFDFIYQIDNFRYKLHDNFKSICKLLCWHLKLVD